MSMRTTIALGVVAAVLLGYILVVERHSLSTRDLEPRKNHLLKRFVRDKVERIAIRGRGTSIVLKRDSGASKPTPLSVPKSGDLDSLKDAVPSTWRLTEPVEAPADAEVVGSLLGSLEWADARTEIKALKDGDRKRFGLIDPRRVVVLAVGQETIELRFGANDPSSRGVYAEVSGVPSVYVVGRDLFEAVDRPAGHFRAKALFEQLVSSKVSALTITRREDGGPTAEPQVATLELSREGGRWRLRKPERFEVSSAAMDAMLAAISGLKAERFVETPMAQTADGHDWLTVTLTVDGSTKTLRVGEPCTDDSKERQVSLIGGPSACVLQSDLEAFRKPVADLRELRLATAVLSDLQGIVVELDGARFELQNAQGWSLDGSQGRGEVDEAALDAWLASLRRLRALGVEPLAAARAKSTRLAPARGKLVFRGRSAGVEDVLEIGAATPEGLYVRRGDEPWVMRFPADAAQALALSSASFQARTLIQESTGRLRRLRVVRGEQAERLEQGAGEAWSVVDPLKADADANRLGELLPRLAHLEAVRFVAPKPDAAHGLARPRFVVEMHFEGVARADQHAGHKHDDEGEDDHGHGHDHGHEVAPPVAAEDRGPRDYVLSIGESTSGGAFAQLKGSSSVFVVASEILLAIEQPLVSRGLLRVDGAHVTQLVLTRSGSSLTLRREPGGFVSDRGEVSAASVDRLLDALGGLRPDRVGSYGPSPASEGLASPRVRLELEFASGAPKELPRSLRAGSPRDGRVPIRRDDLEVTFFVDQAAVEPFLKFDR